MTMMLPYMYVGESYLFKHPAKRFLMWVAP